MRAGVHVQLDDGRIYTGWRAVPWLILFTPHILLALVIAIVLVVARAVTGSDHVLGYDYMGGGVWRRP